VRSAASCPLALPWTQIHQRVGNIASSKMIYSDRGGAAAGATGAVAPVQLKSPMKQVIAI
jgi:hypothetical protein